MFPGFTSQVRRPDGFTLLELLIVTAILGVLAAIAGNRVMRAKLSASEASAVASLRVINSSQGTFAASCAGGGYAIDLADLALPPSGSTEAFISPDLATNGARKSGYDFALARSGAPGTSDVTMPTCNGASSTPATAYHAAADPQPGQAGRHFATDKSGTIFQDGDVLANPIPATADIFK